MCVHACVFINIHLQVDIGEHTCMYTHTYTHIQLYMTCTVYTVHCTHIRVKTKEQSTLYTVQCTLYTVQCTLYSVQCKHDPICSPVQCTGTPYAPMSTAHKAK